MFEELKIKTLVRKIANESRFDYYDKILAYICMFENESKTKHSMIKSYINEFAPTIWEEFNHYITVKNMTDIIKGNQNTVEKTDKLEDIIRKLK